MTPVWQDARVTDWLESGVVALSGFVPPGFAATQARRWSKELSRFAAANGHSLRVDGAQLLAERAALTGASGQGATSSGGAARLLRALDGWVAASLPRPSDLELVAPLIEGDVANPWAALTDWVATRSAADVVDRARLLGIALTRVGEGAAPLELPAEQPLETLVAGSRWLVVDFSSLWAGPLCASLLGLAGARVVKVESAKRLDGARRGEPRFYDLLHAGHETVCIDPASPADLIALKRLVAAAEVVIEGSRPRALRGWGLDAGQAVATGKVWVSITAFGRDQGDRIGFGDDVAAGAGLVGLIDGAPRFVGDAIADPLTGLAAAVAVLRALSQPQSSTRTGRLINLSMASVVAATLDGSVTAPAQGLVAQPPRARTPAGNARPPGTDTARVFNEFR